VIATGAAAAGAVDPDAEKREILPTYIEIKTHLHSL
jgi:hypothetical protein